MSSLAVVVTKHQLSCFAVMGIESEVLHYCLQVCECGQVLGHPREPELSFRTVRAASLEIVVLVHGEHCFVGRLEQVLGDDDVDVFCSDVVTHCVPSLGVNETVCIAHLRAQANPYALISTGKSWSRPSAE